MVHPLNVLIDMVEKQTETINILKEDLNKKNYECSKVMNENLELNKKIITLMQREKMEQQQHVLMGSSIIREVDKDKLCNTEVICKPGAKISDISSEVDKITEKQYDHMALVVGGNDCASNPKSADELVVEYSQLIDKAKTKCEKVTVSSICPRMESEETQQKIDAVNAGLVACCGEKQVIYADSTPSFRLSDGSINDGYIKDDGVHINQKATTKLIQCLKLPIKNCSIGVCRDDATKQRKVKEFKQYEDSDMYRWNTVTGGRRKTFQRQGRCHFCAEIGHHKKDCRHGKKIQCHQCFQFGHKSKFCEYGSNK